MTGAEPDWKAARRLERLSKRGYPLLKIAQRIKRTMALPLAGR